VRDGGKIKITYRILFRIPEGGPKHYWKENFSMNLEEMRALPGFVSFKLGTNGVASCEYRC
jgi:hypothetical protein